MRKPSYGNLAVWVGIGAATGFGIGWGIGGGIGGAIGAVVGDRRCHWLAG